MAAFVFVLVAGIVVGVYPVPERIASKHRLTVKDGQSYHRIKLGGSEGETMRRNPHRTWLTLMAVACLLVIGAACASGNAEQTTMASITATPALSDPPRPTSPRLAPARTINEALSKISYRLETDQPIAIQIETVVYVETTVGQAQRLFDPLGERGGGQFFEGAPDDLPVWAVVATGEFQASETLRGGEIFTYSSLWWVVAIGEKGFITGVNFANSDVGALGTVTSVPLPLPTFPNPSS